MTFDIIEALYFIIPIAAAVFFAVSLFRFCYARLKNKKAPGTYSESQMKTRTLYLVISSVIFGVIALVIIGFIGLLLMAVAYM